MNTALAAERSRASQCGHQRGADGAHPLGQWRARAIQSGPGLSQWREYDGAAWPLGCHRVLDPTQPYGFDVQRSVPSAR